MEEKEQNKKLTSLEETVFIVNTFLTGANDAIQDIDMIPISTYDMVILMMASEKIDEIKKLLNKLKLKP